MTDQNVAENMTENNELCHTSEPQVELATLDDSSERQDEPMAQNASQNPAESSDDPPMSKRKRKRLAQQEKKKMYLKDKRQKERERRKERRKLMRERGEEIPPSRKSLKHNTMAKSNCKVRVILDCSFDELMTEKDIKSIVKQLNFCYAANRRALDALQFHITDFTGRLQSTMDSIGDYKNWDLNIHTEGFQEIYPKKDIVYLSSDSPNVLKTLDDDKVYVIGGLVDHNHHKGLCLELAEKRGLAHAQLPIGDYVMLESRTTLAINHVFEILLRYTETRDWRDAFYKVIPKRKVAAAQGDDNEHRHSSDDDDDTETGHGGTDTRTQGTERVDSEQGHSGEDNDADTSRELTITSVS